MCEQLFRNLHDVSLSKLTTLGGQFTAEFKVCWNLISLNTHIETTKSF